MSRVQMLRASFPKTKPTRDTALGFSGLFLNFTIELVNLFASILPKRIEFGLCVFLHLRCFVPSFSSFRSDYGISFSGLVAGVHDLPGALVLCSDLRW